MVHLATSAEAAAQAAAAEEAYWAKARGAGQGGVRRGAGKGRQTHREVLRDAQVLTPSPPELLYPGMASPMSGSVILPGDAVCAACLLHRLHRPSRMFPFGSSDLRPLLLPPPHPGVTPPR